MEVKDWQRIESMFHAALSLDAEARVAYLDRACKDDEELRAEVTSLLAAFKGRESFMEEPAFALGMKVLSSDTIESLAGELIGPYKILRQLGKGGMGEVYLAEDTRLNRLVALKFFADRFVDNALARRQLVKEAQAVAMLEHPNICAVYGLEEADGHNFIVMQYVEGETLATILRGQRIDAARALNFAKQIVSALAEAHAHGIIHRDIKPQNIVVTTDGRVKVLDFGLAKSVERKRGGTADDSSHISQSGLVVGTVCYMSPEQLRAERLDFRSDIFSLGTVLYELFSGKKPFAHDSDAEAISAILTSQPPPLVPTTNGFMPELNRIIFKCLEKNKEQRYPSTSELLSDLDNLRQGQNGATQQHSLKFIAVAFAILLLLTVVIFAFTYHRLNSPYTLAVLPVNNESTDPSIEYLSDGLADSLIAKLSRLPALRVKPLTEVSGHRGGGSDAQKIGRELDVDVVLSGRLARERDSIALYIELVRVSDGKQLWSGRYGDLNTIPISNIQENVSEQVTSSLGLTLGGAEKSLLAEHETENEEAFRQYLRGRHLWKNRSKENIEKAIVKFKSAIEIDPAYARAHAGLADCYVLMNTTAYGNMATEEAMNRARASAKQALEIDNSLPEAHTSLGVVNLKYDWDWQGAEKRFLQAIRLDPNYAPAHFWYSNLLTITGRQSEAITQSSIAKKLDPLSPSTRTNFCREFYFGRQYDRALTCLDEIIKEDPENISAQRVLGFVYLQKGMNDEAIAIFEKIPEKNRALKAVALGYAYAKAGRRTPALQILTEVEQMSQHTYISPHEKAVIYLGLGERDQAFYWLNKACDERFAVLIYLTVDPAFDDLRSDPRFEKLARRLNLPLLPPA